MWLKSLESMGAMLDLACLRISFMVPSINADLPFLRVLVIFVMYAVLYSPRRILLGCGDTSFINSESLLLREFNLAWAIFLGELFRIFSK